MEPSVASAIQQTYETCNTWSASYIMLDVCKSLNSPETVQERRLFNCIFLLNTIRTAQTFVKKPWLLCFHMLVLGKDSQLLSKDGTRIGSACASVVRGAGNTKKQQQQQEKGRCVFVTGIIF
jgi:hypothetical protein